MSQLGQAKLKGFKAEPSVQNDPQPSMEEQTVVEVHVQPVMADPTAGQKDPQPVMEEPPVSGTDPQPSAAEPSDKAAPQAQTETRSGPGPSTQRLPEQMMHKNRLQEYTQRSSIPLPIYHTVNEGFQHAPRFRSTVLVDGASYTSPNSFSHRKAAEQDVAKLALECISQKIKDEGCPLIREDTIFCKSILNEYAVKMNLEKPIYNTVQSEGLLPIFESSLVFSGTRYTGDAGRNKKEAEQLAARAVILSMLGNTGSGTLLSEIIKSKMKLYVALHRVKDARQMQNTSVPGEGHIGITPGISSDKGKEIEVVGGSENLPVTAIAGSSPGELANIPVTHQPAHEFKKPKAEPMPGTITTPIMFVPPVFEQSPVICSTSGKKRNRKNKKKADKKRRIGSQLPVASVLPLNQASPCSVAQ
ncbi:double-stranded RNA-binding protein 5-like [Malania oleifera]|uniref:double-stranded RNA-binding protein 5-like n=1 Tax=Malania oleifera TaxID=397392 RepID=UPI0025AEA040|nr:double-stranded RNA-binding protein 5-like [Malania oleifera]